jgi:drug/metabolite transporter (DMT)-like permease
VPERLFVQSRRGAYAALGLLTILWGFNWMVMKYALMAAHPVVLNVHRTWLAAIIMFIILVVQRRPFWPSSWTAVIVTGLFQTTLNLGSTTMALAEGGVGRTSVLVFTMPFWTLLLAWPVLHERVKGGQWFAVAFALTGMVLLVEPWNWKGNLAPKLWAIASGFGWAAGTVLTKYFQRQRQFDPLNFLAWQMVLGVLPLTLLPVLFTYPDAQWSVVYVLELFYIAGVSTVLGFLLWIAVLKILPAGTASLNMFAIPVIALVSSMIVFGERLTTAEWLGITCIGIGLTIISVDAARSIRRGRPLPAVPTPLDGG